MSVPIPFQCITIDCYVALPLLKGVSWSDYRLCLSPCSWNIYWCKGIETQDVCIHVCLCMFFEALSETHKRGMQLNYQVSINRWIVWWFKLDTTPTPVGAFWILSSKLVSLLGEVRRYKYAGWGRSLEAGFESLRTVISSIYSLPSALSRDVVLVFCSVTSAYHLLPHSLPWWVLMPLEL